MTGDRVLIIAEAGVNHNGDISRAKEMVRVALECGADIVKFQTSNLDALVSKYAKMAEYQKNNIGKEMSQKDMLRDINLSYEDFAELKCYCDEVGIVFLSTPFDVDSVRFLDRLQDVWKIPSGEITNYPYLVEIANTKKPVIMSTGMSSLEEVGAAVDLLRREGTTDITLLHCTTDYPTEDKDVNLRAMLTLKEEFGCSVGYSDHTRGIDIDLAAVALGASVVEKHFTLDRTLPGPDHKASLEPDELREMVIGIRRVEAALGTGEKTPVEAEMKNISVARKSIVALKRIQKGEMLTEENITTKRPGNGVSAIRWPEVLGTKAIRDFEKDELIEI